MIPKSIFSWSFAERGNFSIGSIDKGLFRKKKRQEFSIKLCQLCYISRNMGSVTETLSHKMFCLIKTRTLNLSILDSVANAPSLEALSAELLRMSLHKSSRRPIMTLSLQMFGLLESLSMPCSLPNSLLKLILTKNERPILLTVDIPFPPSFRIR